MIGEANGISIYQEMVDYLLCARYINQRGPQPDLSEMALWGAPKKASETVIQVIHTLLPPTYFKKSTGPFGVLVVSFWQSSLSLVLLGRTNLDKGTCFKNFPETTLYVGKVFTTFEMLLNSSLFHLKLSW